MTDTDAPRSTDAARTAETMMRAMMEAGGTRAAQAMGLGGELGEMVLAMASENATRFTEAMGAVAAAKTPLDAARIYSEYLMSSTQRVSRQFMDVTQAATRHAAAAATPKAG